ncbi:MAG: alpha-glucosidase [Clostridia bacterium]|nr:alpha-glucosidase [Clostridia bacterium]
MLKLQFENGILNVLVNNKLKLKFEKSQEIATVGKYKATYKMSHGSFRIKTKRFNSQKIIINDIKKIEDDTYEFLLSNDKSIRYVKEGDVIKLIPFELAQDEYYQFSLPSYKNQHIYGGGEHFTKLDMKGLDYEVWVSEHISIKQILFKIQAFFLRKLTHDRLKRLLDDYETYYSQPTFIFSDLVFFHTSSNGRIHYNFKKDNESIFTGYGHLDDFYFGFGSSYEDLLEKLTNIIGRQPKLPDWVYNGRILGVQGGTDIMLEKYNKALETGSKVTGIWIQDWEGRRITAVGKQLYWNWEWDRELYPNLDKTIKELNEKGVKVLGYCNPFLAVEKPLYKEASEKGYCVKDKDGKDYLVTITTFPAAMVDFSNPEAYQWIKNIIKKNMIEFGLAGWMADFGEYLPTDAVLYSGENAEIVHNTWPAIWARINREALEETGNLGKIMFFTRAGHTESVRQSVMMWNGDNHVDFSFDTGLPTIIPATLSLTCVGFGLSHSDIGGYTTVPIFMTRSEECYCRWCEMNAFSLIMRDHEGLNPDLNVQFDENENTLKFSAKMSRIHTHLAPYLKKCVEYNAEKGVGVVRPLFFYYDEEKAYKEKYEYLLGRDILVAPVLSSKKKTRKVYLPNDTWIHIWSGKEYTGSQEVMVEAPLGQIPVFVRKEADAEVKEIINKITEEK